MTRALTGKTFAIFAILATSTTAMIGDTTYDIVMALRAGTAAIGVGWGYHPPEELKAAGAHEVVEAAHEVRPAWLRAASAAATC